MCIRDRIIGGLEAQNHSDKIIANLQKPASNSVLVVSHRADWRNAPENSLQAIQNCIDMGVDVIEIDLKKTKDGHLILMHDKKIDRTTTGKGYPCLLYTSMQQVERKIKLLDAYQYRDLVIEARNNSYRDKAEAAGKSWNPLDDNAIRASKGFNSVSYTHLDVYKRQGLQRQVRMVLVMEKCCRHLLRKQYLLSFLYW